MTQDLKDLCLIKKSSLNRLARAYNYEYGVDDDDAMQALAQDLSGMRLVQDWQPIETAPRDGTEILAYDEDWTENGIENCHWEEKVGGVWMIHPYIKETWHFMPSHWMPLPAAPGLETEEK